jgi:hypothetical protein
MEKFFADWKITSQNLVMFIKHCTRLYRLIGEIVIFSFTSKWVSGKILEIYTYDRWFLVMNICRVTTILPLNLSGDVVLRTSKMQHYLIFMVYVY